MQFVSLSPLDLALAAGGTDNVTVIVAKLGSGE